MENPTVSGLRSRSRSKTPFLRSSCDRENCTEGEDHVHHKSGRKTPVKRSTPVKQLGQPSSKVTTEAIAETEEEHAPSHRTRQSTRLTEKLVKTSDYSSEESLDRLKGSRKEIFQGRGGDHKSGRRVHPSSDNVDLPSSRRPGNTRAAEPSSTPARSKLFRGAAL